MFLRFQNSDMISRLSHYKIFETTDLKFVKFLKGTGRDTAVGICSINLLAGTHFKLGNCELNPLIILSLN